MVTEIERKFVVRFLPEGFLRPGCHILQGYVALDANRTETRVRHMNGNSFLTVKSGKGIARTEVEFAISDEQFAELWELTAGRRIEKRRTRVSVYDRPVELDVYDGDLLGLVVVEVEFESLDAADAFMAPGWFGDEVTDDPRYKNQYLAVAGLPQ